MVVYLHSRSCMCVAKPDRDAATINNFKVNYTKTSTHFLIVRHKSQRHTNSSKINAGQTPSFGYLDVQQMSDGQIYYDDLFIRHMHARPVTILSEINTYRHLLSAIMSYIFSSIQRTESNAKSGKSNINILVLCLFSKQINKVN